MVYWPILLYRVTREFKKISFKTWLLAILSYIVVVSPLIVFDFTHNFDDLLGPVRYLFSQKTSGSVFGLDQLIYHLKNVWLSLGKLLTLNFFTTIQDEHGLGVHAVMTKPSFLLSFFSLATLVWYFIKCIWERHISILLVMVSSILLFYLIYPSIGCEYYLLGFFTLMTIVIALFLDAISWKILTPLLGAFILYNTVTVFTTDQAKYGLLARRNLINQVMLEVRESSFRMETIGKDPRPYHSYGGWRYLFQTYGSRPVSSPADEFFGWIYPDEILGNKPLYKVVISEQVMQDCYVKCTSVTSGAFTAYIFQLN